MGRKSAYLTVSLVFIVATVFTYLYFRGGLRGYIRARGLIGELPIEKQSQAWDLFYGRTNGNEYGGIYAGVTKIPNAMVWVWGKKGLKPFATDEFSVYWHFDGCSKPLDPANPRIPRINDRTLEEWRSNMRVGDYIMVVITNEKMGGTKGNLREVAGMNWWAFLQKGLEEECKK